jgi:hypothetical protein
MPIVIRNNNESPFDSLRRLDEHGNEYWYGREVMPLLGYSNWQPFGGQREDRISVIEKARLSCINSGADPENHFSRVTKQVVRTNNGVHDVDDWVLSRFACYLVAQNGDPRKPEIASAQAYFAISTHEAETKRELEQTPPPQPALPSRQVAKETAETIQFIRTTLGCSEPRLAQFLIDYALNDIIVETSNQTVLTGVKMSGVVEIAEKMGAPVNFNNRSQLGKFVKRQVGHLAQQEERLVNGTMQKVYCYPDCNEVREAINQFFQ